MTGRDKIIDYLDRSGQLNELIYSIRKSCCPHEFGLQDISSCGAGLNEERYKTCWDRALEQECK